MRPIPKSDSCNTLVDVSEAQYKLDDGLQLFSPDDEIIQTHLMLPSDDDIEIYQYLYLPAATLSCQHSLPIDEYLRNISMIYERNDELLNLPHRILSNEKCTSHDTSSTKTERILNVCQGEVAHAVPSQCDVIVSDNATTCHILALRSTNNSGTQPLTSLAHVDRVGCENCIRDVVQIHKNSHSTDDVTYGDDRIEMDVHVMGGFNDADGTSREISTFLMDLLVRIAEEECYVMTMTIRTCAISSMNDNGFCCPVGSGLAVDVTSGECYLASVDPSVSGPATVLRNARLWSGNGKKKLSMLHMVDAAVPKESKIVVEPFKFECIRGTDILLRLPDNVLLQYTSTSPEVENDDFCDNARRTMMYMKDADCQDIFGYLCKEPVVFHRQQGAGINEWEEEM